MVKGADHHFKDPSIQIFTDISNEGWGAHLEQVSTKGLWSKRLHINVAELKVVSLALKRPVPKPNSVGCQLATDNTTVVVYILNKQGVTHSVEMCALL